MQPQDKDFELSHEQLIKACKILLYRFNLHQKKNSYERQELASMIGERVNRVEQLTQKSLEEVNTFLHTIHTDFENFLNKHKKEHTNLNVRLVKMNEDLSQLLESLKNTKSAVDGYATVLTCLVEFNSIE